MDALSIKMCNGLAAHVREARRRMSPTCTAVHSPPRAVLTPRADSALATTRRLDAAFLNFMDGSGFTLAAKASAAAIRASITPARASAKRGLPSTTPRAQAAAKASRVRCAICSPSAGPPQPGCGSSACSHADCRPPRQRVFGRMRLKGLADLPALAALVRMRHARGMTAAHRSLPFGTRVRVTNHRTGRSVVVRINDRGPFVRGRVIDMTPAAASTIGFSGLTPVTLTVIRRS
jgi:Lytic transglycolase